MRWMIPLDGKPSPHNIMLGQWEPTWAEADQGITDGFGAVSALLYGESQCGMANHPIAQLRTEIYESLIEMMQVGHTIHDWESNDCIGMDRMSFPDYGDYSNMPQFAIGQITAAQDDSMAGVYAGDTMYSNSCFVTTQRTQYIIWKKNAFRDCVSDNFDSASSAP